MESSDLVDRIKRLSKYSYRFIDRLSMAFYTSKSTRQTTGIISSVNVWPPIPVTESNVTVPYGFYKPFEMRKKKRELRKR